jgi:tyrosine-protein phosphatase SIW14
MTTRGYLLLCCLVAPVLAGEPGLPDFHRVDANVYRGRQPRPEGYANLAKMGVKTVIDLRGGWLHVPKERKKVCAAGMQYVEERFSGIFAPRDKQIARLLAIMQDPASTPVFIHCRRGADRVGVLIACYRIVHDHWSNEQALAESRSLGLSRFEPLMRRYIRHFDAKRAKLPAAPASTAAAQDSPLAMVFDLMLRNQLPEHAFQFRHPAGQIVDSLTFGIGQASMFQWAALGADAHDAAGDAYHCGIVRDRVYYDRPSADLDVVADANVSKHRGAGSHYHPIP